MREDIWEGLRYDIGLDTIFILGLYLKSVKSNVDRNM